MLDGIFGDMFDFNGDGNLDAFEQAMELDFIIRASQCDDELSGGDDFDPNDFI